MPNLFCHVNSDRLERAGKRYSAAPYARNYTSRIYSRGMLTYCCSVRGVEHLRTKLGRRWRRIPCPGPSLPGPYPRPAHMVHTCSAPTPQLGRLLASAGNYRVKHVILSPIHMPGEAWMAPVLPVFCASWGCMCFFLLSSLESRPVIARLRCQRASSTSAELRHLTALTEGINLPSAPQ